MSLTKTQQKILFSLGLCYQKLNQPYLDKPIKVFISKIEFIELIKSADFIKKQERALYKNLEILEKKKLIEYPEKKIKLTNKGQKLFNSIEKEIKPFLETIDFWSNKFKAKRQLQTSMN